MITTQALIEKFRYALDNGWGYIWGTAGITWTAQRQANATREMTVKYGKRWIGHYVADCSGLFSWAFKELGGYMYHGSDTMFNKYCTAKGRLSGGRRDDGQTLKPGTAVFTGDTGNKGHVGLYIGGGYVIEAKGTQSGVIRSSVTLKKWTWWGELMGVEYGSTPGPDPEPTPEPGQKPTLRRGDRGEYVTLAQTELINKGYSCGSFGADGEFGKATESAVKAFQRDHNLSVDGIIGPNTWAALDSTEPAIKYTVSIPHLSNSQADALILQYPDATKTEERG